ncbi:Radical SAM protein [Gammaproteobacteria bacterium]
MKIAPASEKLFNIIIKLTNRCCLACDYCYIESHQSKYEAGTVSLDIIKKALKDYLFLVKMERGADLKGQTIKLTWHGGEPLLAGISYFKEIVDLEKSVVPSPYRVVNALTTNAVKINNDWIDFFKKEEFQIGVSIDGPKHIHDAHRKWKGGNGSFEDVMKGIQLLKEGDILFGALSVVTTESYRNAEEIFRFFLHNNIKNLNFIPYTTFQNWLSPEEYTMFCIKFFDLWYELDDPKFYVRDFANIIARIFGRESNLCEYTNCFGNYLGLDTNGDIYMCDLLIGNKQFFLGNIKEMSLSEVIGSPRYIELKQLARTNAPSCGKCKCFLICTGGCMYRRYLGKENLPGKDIYCSTRIQLIDHIINALNQSYLSQAAKIEICK